MEQPLQGVRVVELAGGVPAAYCAHLLAGYGADVVRLEGRAVAPEPTDWSLSPDDAVALLAGKQRVVLDDTGVASPPVAAEVAAEVARADVVVVDGRPGRFDVPA